MPASSGFPGVGAVGASHVSPPVRVVVIAGTKTRIRVLEKLLALPGINLAGSAQDPGIRRRAGDIGSAQRDPARP